MSRSQGWCFTINNFTENDEHVVYDLSWSCKYIVCGKEVGELGTPHLQGYVYFPTLKSLAQVRDIHSSAHWEAQRGTSAQAIEYCKKDGDWFENGEPPMANKTKGVVEKERWELALSAWKAGDYEAVPVDIGIRYGRGLEFLASKLVSYDLSDTESKMYWYFGPSGSGKSRRAREENPGCYLKMCNKWWDGYRGQDVVLIEDFDKEHKVLCHHLKIWADRYPFPAEVKGGKIDIRPRTIIVTSNYHPCEIWQENQDYQPIVRRFSCVEFTLDNPIILN